MKQREEKRLTVLVTGGAGFIGSHLTDELLQRTYRVRVLDNLCNGSLENLSHAAHHANFQFIHGDILNKETCLQATQDIDVVYHLACLGVRHSIHSPFENHRVNAEGTLNVLEAVKKNRVKKFFYISTSEIYGGTQSFPIKEEHLPVPFTVYGASKLAGELYTNAFHTCYGSNSSILRIFNNYGPRAHYEGDAGELIPRTIVNLLYDTPPVIFGDGMITRDFFYVKDTARALSDLLPIADELNGTTMNIGTGVEYSITSIVEKIVTFMKKQDIGIRFVDARPADVPRLWVDAARFYDATGFQPAYSFEEGLRETIDYYTRLAQDKNLASQIIVRNWEMTKHDSNSQTASY